MAYVVLKTDQVVQVGDVLTSFRGEKHTVKGWLKPDGASTGRIFTDIGSYYPSVFDLMWME